MMTSDVSGMDRVALRSRMYGDLRSSFSVPQRDLVLYLVEHMLAVGRNTLEGTYDQLCAGIASKNLRFRWFLAPLSIKKTSFYKLLDELKAMGLIAVETVHRSVTRITLNFDWCPVEGEEATVAPVPKRLQKANLQFGSRTQERSLSSQSERDEFGIRTPYKREQRGGR